MVKIQVRLLALLVLGTVSRCDDMVGPHPDSVAVEGPRSSSSPLARCTKTSVEVRFNEVKVKGPDSDVGYRRSTVWYYHLYWATNTTFNMTSTNLFDCASAAASEGLKAFIFNGTCTGYRLDKLCLKCQSTGDVVLFIQPEDNFQDVAAVVSSIEEAPYKLMDIGGQQPFRLYMLSAFRIPDSVDVSPSEDPLDYLLCFLNSGHIIRDPKGGFIVVYLLAAIDLNLCLTDDPCGIQIFVSPSLYNIAWPTVYMFDYCGDTVPVNVTNREIGMLIFSHPGVGCTYYPSEASGECTVTFVPDAEFIFKIGFHSDPENCAGFNITLSETNDDGTMEAHDPCPYWGARKTGGTITFSVTGHPSTQSSGFSAYFN